MSHMQERASLMVTWSCGPGLTSWCAWRRQGVAPASCPECGGRIVIDERGPCTCEGHEHQPDSLDPDGCIDPSGCLCEWRA